MKIVVRHVPAGATAVVEEVVDASGEDEARQTLQARGSVVLVARVPAGRSHAASAGFDVAGWCRELESLLRAGMTAVEAIETLALTATAGPGQQVHQQLLRALRQGAALSAALRGSGVFPEVLVASVTASERTSTLAEALRDYLRYDELLQRLRRQAVSAALYPLLVMALGAAIALFLLLYVIPRFSRMYGSLHGDISTPTAAVLGLSRLMNDHGLWVMGALAAAVASAVWAWQRGGLVRLAVRWVDGVPALRAPWDHFRLAQLYQSLALLFKGGYAFDEALRVCEALALGVRLAAGVGQARRAIAQGKLASEAMRGGGLTDATAQRLLAVGERTGDFAGVLQTIADRHAQAFVTFVERATRLLEPLLLLAVALVVGGLVVMMYLPIFEVAGGLGVPR
jgi:general secretion pathway protein F